MIRVAIVEDDPKWAEDLKNIVERYGKENDTLFRISSFPNGLDFISDYTADYDLVLMDIDMPHMDGLETAKLMRKLDSEVSLIFITALAKYAIKGYLVDACGFLVKPIDYPMFCSKMGRVIEQINKRDRPYLVVNSRIGVAKVAYSDIYYITTFGRYVLLHTKNNVIEMHMSMKEVEKLLAGNGFVRGDNSSMVNLAYVSEINLEGAIVNGELIPCSRKRRKALLDAFTLYWR